MGVPPIRIRAALPDLCLDGNLAQAIGRGANGISPSALREATPGWRQALEVMYGATPGSVAAAAAAARPVVGEVLPAAAAAAAAAGSALCPVCRAPVANAYLVLRMP